jgi:hypothetical protein
MIEFESYVDCNNFEVNKQYKLPVMISSISFSHDNGRCSICINGVEIYQNLATGSDYSVTIDNQTGE